MVETGAPIWEVYCETPECANRDRRRFWAYEGGMSEAAASQVDEDLAAVAEALWHLNTLGDPRKRKIRDAALEKIRVARDALAAKDARIAELEARVASFADLEKRERKALEVAASVPVPIFCQHESYREVLGNTTLIVQNLLATKDAEITNLKGPLREAHSELLSHAVQWEQGNDRLESLLSRIGSVLPDKGDAK